MRKRKLFYIGGGVLLLLAAAWFVPDILIRKKVEERLRALPPTVKLTWSGLHPHFFGASMGLDDLHVRQDSLGHRRQLSVDRLILHGLDYLSLARSRKHVTIRRIELKGVRMQEEERLALEGDIELDSVVVDDMDKPMDTSNIHIGAVRLKASHAMYAIPGAYSKLRLVDLELDSRRHFLHIDTVRLVPTVKKLELGGIRGHQVDYIEATGKGVAVEGLDVMALLQHRLVAEEIRIQHSNVYVFRDRRLPMVTDVKPLPVAYLRTLPLSVRVAAVKLEGGSVVYEEFPQKGSKTGVLRIERLHATVRPLINHPISGDPAFITVVTEGSLMGSGTVKAVMKMPLHKGDAYKVEGAFHELDVTKLNPSAENLGDIHLESGILNSLAFSFDMNEEKATGSILGEYHDLVVDKLRGKDDKKVDKIKSFFLKKLIIPRNKDHSLPESRRTGKVDYKRDPERYFSYYMLHALLVGVKSSFSLGFLLPG